MPRIPLKSEITDFGRRFIYEYLKDLKGSAAWLRAGGTGKIEHASCRAYQFLLRPEIQEAVAAANAERKAKVIVEGEDVLRRVMGAATADPNDIVQIRRACCRHCHGEGFRYQYKTKMALGVAERAYKASDRSLVEEFSHGGVGYNHRRDPHPDCPECGGEGEPYVHVNDSRNLSPEARALFAGAKQTRDGIEVKLNSQDKSRELLMRHLGLLNDKLELTGDMAERIIRARRRAGG